MCNNLNITKKKQSKYCGDYPLVYTSCGPSKCVLWGFYRFFFVARTIVCWLPSFALKLVVAISAHYNIYTLYLYVYASWCQYMLMQVLFIFFSISISLSFLFYNCNVVVHLLNTQSHVGKQLNEIVTLFSSIQSFCTLHFIGYFDSSSRFYGFSHKCAPDGQMKRRKNDSLSATT